jgi:predicted GNAT family acetyltransferase
MNVVRHADAAAFLQAAEPWLLRAEVENNVVLTLAHSIADGTRPQKEPPYFATAQAGGEVVCCAVRTPPHRLLVTAGPAAALRALAQDARDAFGRLPGVNGPQAAAAAFAAAWCAATSDLAAVDMRFRIHSATRVAADLPPCSGALHAATADDRALAIDWFTAFVREALPNEPHEPDEAVDRLLRLAALFFWRDPAPVAVVGCGNRLVHGARIGPVYTPPSLRGRGYGTAAVAGVTHRLLGGASYCCLYTDLANPTSNSIYRRIGYRPVCDVDQYTFQPTAA